MQYEPHEIANLFPMMGTQEYTELVGDIKANGLRNPIVLFDGKILDGRNRYNACCDAGVLPGFDNFIGSQKEAIEFVWSENFCRRHLNSSQRAMVAVERDSLLMDTLKAEAKQRQVEHGNTAPGKPKTLTQKIVEVSETRSERETAAKIAKAVGTNRQYVNDAVKIKEKAPEKVPDIISGKKTIAEAKREIKRQEYEEQVKRTQGKPPPLPATEKPNLVLADPPWRYEHARTNSRKIENQYDTTTLDEIAGHNPTTQEDCILFLWATAPKLEEAIGIMGQWGFTYRTHCIWDKQAIGMGYWFRGQHELLLLGIKGRPPAPLPDFRVSSIFSERRGQHSKKPECIYEWIERAFGDRIKLEMYCRKPREGWQVWGNQV